MQNVTILGSTGSIGVSTLDVIVRHPDRFRVHALTAHSKVEELARQCLQHRPLVAVVGTAEAASRLAGILREQGSKTIVEYGRDALCAVASAADCHAVMAAIVGAAGLEPTLAAARAGKKVLLANKEALVMSGSLFMDAVAANGAVLMPIDSEHNAIFQCLPVKYDRRPDAHGVAKIILTASGGPFLRRAVDTLGDVTPEEAVAHPKWVMGRKISVDSATMMNKGLEVIEAHWLFGAPAEKIDVVIHPQSVVHSMVTYADGSVLAQMGNPDMRTPIAHALAFPQRIASGVAPIDLPKIGQLVFEQPDFGRFPCLRLAYDALSAGGSSPTILNAANEIAVFAFLHNRIGFLDITEMVERTMNKIDFIEKPTLEEYFDTDGEARNFAASLIQL